MDPDEAHVLGGPGYSYSFGCDLKSYERSHYYVEYTAPPPPVPIGSSAIFVFLMLAIGYRVKTLFKK